MKKTIKLSSHSSQIILDTLVSEGHNVTVVSAKYKLLKVSHDGKVFLYVVLHYLLTLSLLA